MAKSRLLDNYRNNPEVVEKVDPQFRPLAKRFIETGDARQAGLDTGLGGERPWLELSRQWGKHGTKPEGEEVAADKEHAALLKMMRKEARSAKSPTARIRALEHLIARLERVSVDRTQGGNLPPQITIHLVATQEELDQLRTGGHFQEPTLQPEPQKA